MSTTHTRRTGAGSAPAAPRERLLTGLPVEERTLTAAGIPTTLLEGGKGAPIVILHGPGEFAARWFRVIPGLVEHHRIVIPDLPGHGASGVGDGVLDAARIIEWLDGMLDATCPEPPVLVGHILGGAIGARFALERPERLRRLVLVDSLGLAPFRPSPRFALGLLGFMVRPTERSYERMMAQCEHDSRALADAIGSDWEAVRDYAIEQARDPRSGKALRTLMKSVGVPPLEPERLARMQVPTTLIWGRHDRALKIGIAEEASRRYGWPLHVIEDTADDAPFEQPAAFLATLEHVLETHVARNRSHGG